MAKRYDQEDNLEQTRRISPFEKMEDASYEGVSDDEDYEAYPGAEYEEDGYAQAPYEEAYDEEYDEE